MKEQAYHTENLPVNGRKNGEIIPVNYILSKSYEYIQREIHGWLSKWRNYE